MTREITEAGMVAARTVSEIVLGDPKWADLFLGFMTAPQAKAGKMAWQYISQGFEGGETEFEALVAYFDETWRINGGGRVND
jgi:hypothetical protein